MTEQEAFNEKELEAAVQVAFTTHCVNSHVMKCIMLFRLESC